MAFRFPTFNISILCNIKLYVEGKRSWSSGDGSWCKRNDLKCRCNVLTVLFGLKKILAVQIVRGEIWRGKSSRIADGKNLFLKQFLSSGSVSFSRRKMLKYDTCWLGGVRGYLKGFFCFPSGCILYSESALLVDHIQIFSRPCLPVYFWCVSHCCWSSVARCQTLLLKQVFIYLSVCLDLRNSHLPCLLSEFKAELYYCEAAS